MADEEESKLVPDAPMHVEDFTEQVRDLLNGMEENEEGLKTFADWFLLLQEKLLGE